MKLKTTKKQIRDNTSDNLFSVGYCDLQSLLRYKNAFAYSSGVYGWACDYYELELNGSRIIISTGYQPIGKQLPSTLIEKYEDLSSTILNASYYNPDLKKSHLDTLINQFLNEVNEVSDLLL